MTIIQRTHSWLLAPLLMLALGSSAMAASKGIRDDAHFFSAGAVSQAQQTIDQIADRHQKDVLVETFAGIPDDQKSRFEQLGKDAFFSQWANSRARSQAVNGIYLLVTKDPAHLEMAVGNRTQQGLFTLSDRNAVRDELLTAFKSKQFDQGLTDAMKSILERMNSNAKSAGMGTGAVSPGRSPTYTPPAFPPSKRSWSFGSIACILIAVVLFIVMIRGIFGRSGGQRFYGGGYPQGGYPQGGYPPQGGYGGYGGGGGGGFGQGLLGGLLGGALGGYAAQKWTEHGQQGGGGYVPPASGGGGGDFGGGGTDTSFDSSGGDFGGGGGGGGGDFGGGGGGDSGGGGGGGGDF